MKVLLLNPEDSPRRGPWLDHKWDLIVDLANSSEASIQSWQQQLKCRMISAASFRHGPEDLATVRNILQAGNGYLIDGQGIDWWKLTSILIHYEIESVLLLNRMLPELSSATEVFSTRKSWFSNAMAAMLGTKLQNFTSGPTARYMSRVQHYAGIVRRLKAAQIGEIAFDKYDADYGFRRRLALRRAPFKTSVVLIPSAYTNVSRMAVDYARVIPEQQFLLVATRRSGSLFGPAPNVTMAKLAAYVGENVASDELASVLAAWKNLKRQLEDVPELKVLSRLGILESFDNWIRDGFAMRDAWNRVLNREPVQAVLCGDDTNYITRLPVLLARNRGIPTIDFHHGAFDGRFLLKEMASELYLAKSEMERDYLVRICRLRSDRVLIGAPASREWNDFERSAPDQKTAIVYFSEPYEASGQRTEEIYRELLPPLRRLAQQHGCKLVVKLHPFESASERQRLVCRILGTAESNGVEIIDGPLASNLLARTWFGITVQSTTAIDCSVQGVPCFLCEWLESGTFGYIKQYARFGVGKNLSAVSEIEQIPGLVTGSRAPEVSPDRFWKPISSEVFRGLIGGTRAANVVNVQEHGVVNENSDPKISATSGQNI